MLLQIVESYLLKVKYMLNYNLPILSNCHVWISSLTLMFLLLWEVDGTTLEIYGSSLVCDPGHNVFIKKNEI